MARVVEAWERAVIRHLPAICRFALTASSPGDVVFKITALLVLTPVIVVVCVGSVIDGVWRATR